MKYLECCKNKVSFSVFWNFVEGLDILRFFCFVFFGWGGFMFCYLLNFIFIDIVLILFGIKFFKWWINKYGKESWNFGWDFIGLN